MHGRAGQSEEYKRYIFAKEYGWDFWTFENQPKRYIEEMMFVMAQVAEKERSDKKDQERASRRSSKRRGA